MDNTSSVMHVEAVSAILQKHIVLERRKLMCKLGVNVLGRMAQVLKSDLRHEPGPRYPAAMWKMRPRLMKVMIMMMDLLVKELYR